MATQWPVKLSNMCRCHVSGRHWRKLLSWSSSPRHHSSDVGSTYNEEEVDKFSKYAEGWWDERGEAAPLHALNELRVPLVRRGLGVSSSSPRPLRGLRILDVGCGGGLLSEPLARLGASVVGIDASIDNVQVARQHAESDTWFMDRCEELPEYRCCTVEQLAREEAEPGFDAVVASEVLEHVDSQNLFIDICCQMVKPGGSLFITTPNRTRFSWLMNIVGAEQVARILPAGTHDWNKFVTPDELNTAMSSNGLVLRLLHGMMFNPITGRWSWCSNTASSYAVHAVKPRLPEQSP